MRRLLFTGTMAAGIYAVVAVAIVVGARVFGTSGWGPAVVYLGGAFYFMFIVAVNRLAFRNIPGVLIRWTALLGACGAMTAISVFLVFVLSVNVHLALGGRT